MKTLSEGLYTTIQQDQYNRLIITATKKARNLRARGELWADDDPEYEKEDVLLGDLLSNLWERVYPYQIGALVGNDCLILSNDWRYEEDREDPTFTALWYHERYAVELFSEQVFEGGVMMLPVPVLEVTE